MSGKADPVSYGDAASSKNEKLLPTLIDEIARNDPSTVFCEVSVSPTTYSQGFRQINYGQLAMAIDGAAWWLRNELGESNTFETLTYIGPNDLRYPILVFGAVKAGYKVLLTSPRNSVPAHENLMKLLGCTKLITPTPAAAPVAAIMASCEVQLIEFPSLEFFLDETHPSYPYAKTYETAKQEPLVVLHTSGSTGLPKPLVLPHAFGTAFANTTQIQPPPGYISQTRLLHGRRLITTLPLFHAVGIYFGLISPVYNRTTPIWPLSGTIPSAVGVVEVLKFTKAESMLLAPSIVEDISKDQSLLDTVASNVDAIAYTGGDLPQRSGDIIASKVALFPLYGSTEMAHGPQIFPMSGQADTDWKYFGYTKDVWGAEFCHYNEDLHELRLKQTTTSLRHQPAFTLFPRETDFSTRDLFFPHPTTPDLWSYGGRSDDIIVFLNGEKTNPLSTEGHLISHPEVRSAMVLGERRLEAALLVEPIIGETMSVRERAELLERIWPTIEAANQECPAYAKISKSLVMFTKPEKPVVRAGKGTVMRKATQDLYAEETARLYSDANQINAETSLSNAERDALINHPERLRDYVCQQVLEVTGWISLGHTDDFIPFGMDSLQALRLARKLQRVCKVSPSTIYTNSTVLLLAQAMAKIVANHEDLKASDAKAQYDAMGSFLTGYQEKLSKIKVEPAAMMNGSALKGKTSDVVLLTGSTGALGSYILNALLGNTAVAHIYCLNRSLDSSSLQSERNKARHLPTAFPNHRVTFLTGDLAANEMLGLDENDYLKVRSEITHIIHNAWTVDFNLALSSFAPHLAGIVNLVKLASCGKHLPRILFLSSISSVQNWSMTKTVPEDIMTEFSVPAANGYGRSKHLAERLLQYASEKLNVKADVVRIGQIAGPRTGPGKWNRNEWFPSLAITARNLGAVPESLGGAETSFKEIDWIPVDEVADILVDLTLGSKDSSSPGNSFHVRHLVNPRTRPWDQIRSSTLAALQGTADVKEKKVELEVVPYLTWLDLLRSKFAATSSNDDMDALVAKYPAIKLLEFFESLASGRVYPVLDTSETQKASSHMRALEAIDDGSMMKWVAGWFDE